MKIERCDPPCWFANMNNNKLQLILYGKDLLNATVSLSYQHELKTVVEYTSKNYLVLNIDITNVRPNTSCSIICCKSGEQSITEYKFLPRRDKNIETLSMKDSIYLLMPDRFDSTTKDAVTDKTYIDKNNPDAWHGGTITGLTKRLDHICDMGFSAVWHTPIFENKQSVDINTKYYDYHGYAITDYYALDSHFGSINEYCDFVSSAHKKGIKVIMDMVFNHCGMDHPFYKNPPIPSWFNNLGSGKHLLTNKSPLTVYDIYASSYDKQHFVKGWFTPSMPDVNMSNETVMNYLTQMTIWWIETTDIDAIRLDTYPYAGIQYMEKWQKRLYEEYPQFPLLAEDWVSETEYLALEQSHNFDSVDRSELKFMDFAFQRRVSDAFANKDAMTIYSHFALDFAYKKPDSMLAFLDNHDLERWFHKHPSVSEFKQAIGLLLTVPRIPQVYYGTEILLDGDGCGSAHGNMRQDYPWDKRLNKRQIEMKDYMSKLLNWRRKNQCITDGGMIHFVPLDDNVYVYFRYIKDSAGGIDCGKPLIMIAVNFSGSSTNMDMTRFAEVIGCRSVAIDIMEERDYSDCLQTYLKIDANEIVIIKIE